MLSFSGKLCLFGCISANLIALLMFMQATAGLRQLEGDASDRILQAVTTFSIISYSNYIFYFFSGFHKVTLLNYCVGEGFFED